MVTVVVAKRAYEMEPAIAEKLIAMAGEMVPHGIYAIRKKGYIELRNDQMSNTKLRELRWHFKKLGFKVYANGV